MLIQQRDRTTSACRGKATNVTLHAGQDAHRLVSAVEWQQLARSHSQNALFQSPAWFDHLRTIEPDRAAFVIAVRDANGQLTGVVPVVEELAELAFSIGAHNLWMSRLRALEILGSEPLLEHNLFTYDQVFSAIEKGLPSYDAISISMVPIDGFFWRYLNNARVIKDHFVIYLPDGVQRSRLIEMPASFDDYLSQFSAKARYNLKREVRRLRERGQTLQLKRYESPDDVTGFLEATETVVAQCWQQNCVKDIVRNNSYWSTKLLDLSDKGLLRSYVLVSDGQPCAVALGYQLRDVFYLVQTYYDQRLASYSPGRVLLFLYLQDLMVDRPVRLHSFGYSDAHYKAFFSNAYSDDVCMLLLRRNLTNRLKKFSHSSFRSFVNFVKRRVRRTRNDSRLD